MISREQGMRAACGGLLAAAVVLLAVTAAWGLVGRPEPPDPGDTGFRVGETVEGTLASLPGRGQTLLVFLRSDCPASRAAITWLPAVSRQMATAGIDTVLVVASEGGESERAFAASAGFDSSHVLSASFASLPLRAVPSFVVVDADGVVLRQRAGLADESAREAFVDGFRERRN